MPSYYPSKESRGLNCIVYSKNAAIFLSELGFPKGIKSHLNIPFILENDKNLASCIRGIMDTDGSLSAHPHVKIMIHLSVTSKTLRKDICFGLKKFEINLVISIGG